jgi:hypothetical protein
MMKGNGFWVARPLLFSFGFLRSEGSSPKSTLGLSLLAQRLGGDISGFFGKNSALHRRAGPISEDYY